MDQETMAVLAEAKSALLETRTALLEKDGVIGRLSALIERQAPLAEIGAAITAAGKWYTVAEAAKQMSIDLGDGKRMGQNQLYAYLRSTHMVLRKHDPASGWSYHQPYQSHVDAGHFKLEDRPTHFETPRGDHLVQRRTLISPKGLAYLKARITAAQAEGILDGLVTD